MIIGSNMKNHTILIVDDEEPIRSLFRSIFSDVNYTVESAENAQEALDILDKKQIKLLFLDINMPGMNGLELCKKIRETNKVSVICAITGFEKDFDRDKCKEVGFDYYFRKPVRLEKLIKLTNDVFTKFDSKNK